MQKNFKWNHHIENIRSSLLKKFNLIRILSNKKWGAHSKQIIKLISAIMLGKINHGLSIYGQTPITTFNRLKAPYHAAIRAALGAFITSPIPTLLKEAGLPDLNSIYKLEKNKQPKVPTWKITKKNILRNMEKKNKNNSNPIEYIAEFVSIKEKYKNWKFIYTDASKTNIGVGYAVVTEEK